MWSVYRCSEAEWRVGLGEMCVTERSIVRYTHCSVYLVAFNTDLSTLGSVRFWVSIGYVFLIFFLVILLIECCVLFFVKCYCIVLYCTLLYCPVFHCSTLPAGINPFSVNNNNNNNNNNNVTFWRMCVLCKTKHVVCIYINIDNRQRSLLITSPLVR